MSKPIPTITEHKIGKTVYHVVSSSSEKATETIDKKIQKMIKKDMQETAVNQHFKA